MSSDGISFYYGTYEHPKGEVYPRKLEIRPMASDRGVRWATLLRMEVAGSFVNQDPELDSDGVNDRIAELEQVYRFDYEDCGFLLPDGSDSEHYMLTDDEFNLSGNKIANRSWDNEYPTEMANTRSFSVTIEALFLQSYSDILYFSESTQKIGTGGPIWRQYNIWDGLSVREDITTYSKVRHITRGTIVGRQTWPNPPGPLWPLEEQKWRREITQLSPRFHGDMTFTKGTHYAVNYAYYFERPNADPTTNTNTWYDGT